MSQDKILLIFLLLVLPVWQTQAQPQTPSQWEERARCYEELHQLAVQMGLDVLQALEEESQQLAQPMPPAVFFFLGFFWYEAGDLSQATTYYERFIATAPASDCPGPAAAKILMELIAWRRQAKNANEVWKAIAPLALENPEAASTALWVFAESAAPASWSQPLWEVSRQAQHPYAVRLGAIAAACQTAQSSRILALETSEPIYSLAFCTRREEKEWQAQFALLPPSLFRHLAQACWQKALESSIKSDLDFLSQIRGQMKLGNPGAARRLINRLPAAYSFYVQLFAAIDLGREGKNEEHLSALCSLEERIAAEKQLLYQTFYWSILGWHLAEYGGNVERGLTYIRKAIELLESETLRQDLENNGQSSLVQQIVEKSPLVHPLYRDCAALYLRQGAYTQAEEQMRKLLPANKSQEEIRTAYQTSTVLVRARTLYHTKAYPSLLGYYLNDEAIISQFPGAILLQRTGTLLMHLNS